VSAPADALHRSRFDPIAAIRDGIPPRSWVPGARGLIPAGKRLHVAGERKSGKSLAFGVVTAARIVAAGGTVALLDRENGAEEYARRLRDVLAARQADTSTEDAIRERLRYHAWPMLDLRWRDDPAWPEALAGADLVIFDSSRSHLSPLGLKEDGSDDFAAFATALIDPLAQAGIATIVLDNVGHVERDRARGTSSKEDLADVALLMRTLSPFSAERAGRVELRCTASRLGDIGGCWQMSLGGGHFGEWERAGTRPPEAREDLREAAADVLTDAGEAMGVNKLAKTIRERPGNGLKFADSALHEALKEWASDPASGIAADPSGRGFVAHSAHPRYDAIARDGRHNPPRGGPPQGEKRSAEPNPAIADDDAINHHGAIARERPPVGGATPAIGHATGEDGELVSEAVERFT
jgi:AAA domain